MNEDQIAGMRARAAGRSRETCQLSGLRKLEWTVGFDLMEVNIEQILRNADATLASILEIKKRQNRVVYNAA